MAEFDASAAKAAGHSDEDIARIQRGIVAARAAGYSDEEIKAHLSGAKPPTEGAPPEQPNLPPSGSSEASPPQGWSASRLLGDLGHYPAMGAQAIANGAIAMGNFPMAAANLINRYTAPVLPNVLTGNGDTSDYPLVPSVDLGDIAKPQNTFDKYLNSAIEGGSAALTGGAISRVPALLSAGGHEIASAMPALLREAGVLGVVPAGTAEFANQHLDLDKLGPDGKAAAEMAIGATAAIASHHYLGGDPVGAVADKLGKSENSDHAGGVTQDAVREWRAALPAKVEELKGITHGPVTPEGDVTADKLFGKIPLDSATADMTETLKTVNAMSRKGGMVAPLLHEFGNDMPVKVKAILEDIAAKNNPIMEYPPKAVVTPSGPLRADTSPIVEGERGDLVKPPVSKLDRPAAGLLAPPTETPIAQPGVSPQTNPVQWGMENPGVAGIEPRVVQTNPQLPSVVTRNGLPTETVDPGMTGSKQLGEPRTAGAGASAASPTQGLAKMPGEPTYPPEYKNPDGTIVGFPLPLRDAMELRSWIGEQTSRGMMPKGTTPAQWDALYKGLSADIGNTAELHGARPEWDNYNAKTSQLYTDGEKLAKFSNDDNPTKDTAEPGKAVSQIWNSMEKDSSEITKLREHVPGAADEIAAAYLRKSPEKWNKLPSASQAALVPNPFDRLTLNSSVVKKPDLVTETSRNREPLVAGGYGYGLAKLLEPRGDAEGSTSLLSPAAWSALAMGAPAAVRFAGRVRENPRMLNVPITGGVAAGGASDRTNANAPASSPLLSQPSK